MRGLLVSGGKFPHIKYIKKYINESAYIIAADSGLDTLHSYGYEADLVVGDMDSIKGIELLESMDEHKIIKYPQDKDFTDTELALHKFEEKGIDDIVMIGGGGGRLDHIIALYTLFSRQKSPKIWITHREIVYLVEHNFLIDVQEGQIISLFPLGNSTCKMSSSGLKWELNKLSWDRGSSGISNVAVSKKVKINMETGKLLMILPLGSKDYNGK